jgi:hypothetical protein
VDEKQSLIIDGNCRNTSSAALLGEVQPHPATNSQEFFADVIVDKPLDRLIESASLKDPTKF